MKLKTLTVLVASAFVGVATTASAGTIQASYKNYAAEVFGDNTVLLTAPTINYALATPLSGTSGNPNTFNISWTIDNGQWAANPGIAAVSLADPTNTHVVAPTNVALSADGKTVTATFLLNDGFLYTVGSQVVLGTGDATATLTKIGSILGAPATDGCGSGVASINVTVALTNAAGAPFDSSRPDATNTTPLAQSKVAIGVTATNSANYALPTATPPGPGPELGKINVLQPSLGTEFTDGDGKATPTADVTGHSTVLLDIGSITVKDKVTGLYDLNGKDAYSVNTAGFGTDTNTQVGIVEASGLVVNVSGQFVTPANGGSITGNLDSACGNDDVIGTGIIAADGKSATLNLAADDMPAIKAAKPVYICYTIPGTKQIPTSQFQVTGGQLSKYGDTKEAANPVCAAPIYNLVTNGVRVDVRNYVPDVARAPSGGWYSVIRVINTDAAQASSPVIQALLANGTLGASANLNAVASVDGKTGALAANEVRYYTSDKIDAALNANATAGSPSYGAADIGGNARLRITSPTSSIRVQNYVYNPTNGNFVEASAAQGDDGPDYDRKADRDNK